MSNFSDFELPNNTALKFRLANVYGLPDFRGWADVEGQIVEARLGSCVTTLQKVRGGGDTFGFVLNMTRTREGYQGKGHATRLYKAISSWAQEYGAAFIMSHYDREPQIDKIWLKLGAQRTPSPPHADPLGKDFFLLSWANEPIEDGYEQLFRRSLLINQLKEGEVFQIYRLGGLRLNPRPKKGDVVLRRIR